MAQSPLHNGQFQMTPNETLMGFLLILVAAQVLTLEQAGAMGYLLTPAVHYVERIRR